MPYDPIDLDEYRYNDRHERRYRAQLYAHTDCRDPSHPGCENCEHEFDEYITEE